MEKNNERKVKLPRGTRFFAYVDSALFSLALFFSGMYLLSFIVIDQAMQSCTTPTMFYYFFYENQAWFLDVALKYLFLAIICLAGLVVYVKERMK